MQHIITPTNPVTAPLTTSAAQTDQLPGRVLVVVSGADALISFGENPDVDTDGGGIITTQTPLIFTLTMGSKASFKAMSGSGTITFWPTT